MSQDCTCPVCGKWFKNGKALGGHKRVHSAKHQIRHSSSSLRKKSSSMSPPKKSSSVKVVRGRGDIHRLDTHLGNSSEDDDSDGADDEYIPVGREATLIDADTNAEYYRKKRRKNMSRKRKQPMGEGSIDRDTVSYSVESQLDAALFKEANADLPAAFHSSKRRKVSSSSSMSLSTIEKAVAQNRAIGADVTKPSELLPPTEADAIRKQVGLALSLYGFDSRKMAEFCEVTEEQFRQWLNGGRIKEEPSTVYRTSGGITKSLRFDMVKPRTDGLPWDLSSRISTRMKVWIHDFIANGFANDSRFTTFLCDESLVDGSLILSRGHFAKKRRKLEAAAAQCSPISALKMKCDPFFSEELVAFNVSFVYRSKEMKDTFLWDPFNGVGVGELVASLCDEWGVAELSHRQRLEQHITARILQCVKSQLLYVKSVHDRAVRRGEIVFGKQSRFAKPVLGEDSLKLDLGNRKAVDKYRSALGKVSGLLNANAIDGLVEIKLQISEDNVQFSDQLLWDLNDASNDVCLFARTLVRDLALPKSFEAKIAQSIVLQTEQYKNQVRSGQPLAGANPIHRPTAVRSAMGASLNQPKLETVEPVIVEPLRRF